MPGAERDADPLALASLDPGAIQAKVNEKTAAKKAPPTEHELEKERRLAAKEKRLASAPATAKVSTQQQAIGSAPTESELAEYRTELLDKLNAYRERFPHLKKRNNVTPRSSIEDISDEVHYCELQLGSKSDTNLGALLLQGTMVAVETIHRDVWNPLGLNLNGLAKVTKDNMAELQPIVDELLIKYGAGMYMGPELRLALSLGALVFTVHAANSGDARVAVALQRMNETVKTPDYAKQL